MAAGSVYRHKEGRLLGAESPLASCKGRRPYKDSSCRATHAILSKKNLSASLMDSGSS